MQERARREASGYYAHCEALDRCVGDVVATLDKEGLLDRTVVVFTSDHGEMLGSHGCAPFMKQAPWSEAACVPLLIRSPGAVARTVATPIGTPDLLPTLLGLAGVRVPHSIEGEDLSGLVRGGSERPGRAALYMSVSPFHGDRRLDHEYRAIRTSTHTYVRSLTGPWMLYDDLADPHQMRNLIGVPAYDQVRSDLDARLQSELRRIGDDFRPRCHYIKRFGYEIAPHGSISYAEGARPQSPRPSERL
jgi:arylsulfatase A-like enzyme